MKRIFITKWLALSVSLVLLSAGCAPTTDTQTPAQDPDTAPAAPEEAPTTQGVTSNWRLNAYNPATDSTLSFLIVFENVQGGLAGNAYAYDPSAPEPTDPLGSVSGQVSSREQLDFRITFAESLGGGTWDVTARLNNSAFAGSYTASDGGGGSVIGSNLDGN